MTPDDLAWPGGEGEGMRARGGKGEGLAGEGGNSIMCHRVRELLKYLFGHARCCPRCMFVSHFLLSYSTSPFITLLVVAVKVL